MGLSSGVLMALLLPVRPGALVARTATPDPRVAEVVNALDIRYVSAGSPVVRGFVIPDGLMSLDNSRSWTRIYDNGESRIYEWRGDPPEQMRRQDSNDDPP